MIEVEVYKTYEISDKLWNQIASGFNESFDGHNTNGQNLKKYAQKTRFGYSYHAIAFADAGEIAGFNTFTPYLYKDGLKVVLSGSSYIRKQYRSDTSLFKRMIKKLREVSRDDGFRLHVGVPNHNSFRYATIINKSKFLFDLRYYILPIKLSKILDKSSLKWIDFIIYPFIFLYCYIVFFISSVLDFKEREVKYKLQLDGDFYEKSRFTKNPYIHYAQKDISCIYRIVNDKGNVNVAYLIDFREKKRRTSRALAQSIIHILNNETIDAIMFVGTLNLHQLNLIRTPRRFAPQRLPLVCHIMDKEFEQYSDEIQNPRNWDFSLINFDVR